MPQKPKKPPAITAEQAIERYKQLHQRGKTKRWYAGKFTTMAVPGGIEVTWTLVNITRLSWTTIFYDDGTHKVIDRKYQKPPQ